MIVTIEDVLTAQELSALRAQLRDAPWAEGINAGTQARAVKHNQQLPESAPALAGMRTTVMRALNRSTLLVTAALPFKVLPPNFNRYTGATNAYGLHVDSSLRPLPGGSYLRTDLSATLFLSEPQEYDGGELSIEDTFGRQLVKLKAGGLVVYPSGSVHEVRPVTRGERLACYLFLQSLVKDTESRRMLFEMDMALVALRQRYGEEDADLVRLTGLYNNLLRRWSEC
jgi:PKHD-type hydroxylase